MTFGRPRKSLVLWLQGGLGNQLFQLHGANALSIDSGIPLIVSRASFLRDRLRDIGVAPLLNPPELLTWSEELVLGWPYRRNGQSRGRLMPSGLDVVHVDEPGLAAAPGALLLGFFQSPHNLNRPTDAIVAKLKAFRENFMKDDGRTHHKFGNIAHVRRTDYVSSTVANSRFGSLGRPYYERAFAHLGIGAKDVVFFTDDVQFVQAEFDVPRDQIVGPRDTKTDLEALLLMSKASNMVIANSTFSWWAAEVAGADATAVCTPRTWFRNEADATSLARSRWIRISNGQ